MPQPTLQQQRAIDARGVSVVLSSGAGCGKTSVLTARYLKLLEDGAGVPQIVAITFTDRAAREMRDRIRQAITARIRAAPADSATPWTGHLRHLETAPISTFHAFCGNILRQHAVRAGLDSRFEILEEALSGTWRAESLQTRLHDLLVAPSLAGEDLRELIVEYGWTETVAAIRHLVADADPTAWTKWLELSPDRIEASWLGEARNRLRGGWVDYLVAADSKIASCLNLLNVTPCRGPEMKKHVARLLSETPALGRVANLAAAVAELKECAKVGKERGKAWADEETYRRIKKAFDGFREAIVDRLAPFVEEPGDLQPAIRHGQRFIRVALEVAEAYREQKQRAGCLDFQDLLVLARDLVRDQSEVREALQQHFKYILLDESQDTDPVQMELVEHLCGDVALLHGKLFAVGDHKQSIYRFRGAEVGLFRELRERIPEAGRLSLSGNFRSQKPILDFVNALCSRRISGYEPLKTDRPIQNREPCVEFLWAVPNGEASGRESVGTIRKREADAIARRIRTMLDNGGERRLYQKEKSELQPVRMQDIVLLFRSMSNVALYEEALRRHGIDYYLVGGRAFFAQQEVYDLLNLLRALENPDDSLSLAGALRSPFACLSDETLYSLSADRTGKIWEGLHDDGVLKQLPREQKEAVLRARRNFQRWREVKDRLPIARLIGVLFADTGYDAAMQFEFLADRKLANLWKLQDLARTFDRTGLFGLADFIERLGELVRHQPREEQAATLPEKADVVRLMSIHQAKGLEFPVVFVPDMAAPKRGGDLPVAHWHRELGCLVNVPEEEEDDSPFADFGWRLGGIADTIADWEEDLRILYVACTRAEDLLILSAGLPEPLPTADSSKLPVPLKAPSMWMLALGERFHLRSGACIADDLVEGCWPEVRVRIVEGIEQIELPPT